MSESYDLISAASLGQYKNTEEILKNNLVDVNGVNESGWTALMYAANYGHFNIIKLMIKYNCNVNYQDSQGKTALMIAASMGHTRSIDALINCGKGDKSLKDVSGFDAMNYAKNNGHGNNKLIKNLLLKPSDAYQVKGRSCPAPKHSIVPAFESKQKSIKTNETSRMASNERNYLYNPCEPTPFSNSLSNYSDVWRPIRSQNCSQSNDTITEFVSTSMPPPMPTFTLPDSDSNGQYSSESGLSSSQSSIQSFDSSTHTPVISLPPNYRRKPTSGRKKPVLSISGPMPNSLFHLLTRIDLIQYLNAFENNSIDFYLFLTLTDEDFQNLGITSFGHRKKLSIAQKRYHESLDISCTQESFFVDFLLNERDIHQKKIRALEEKIKCLEFYQN